MSGFPTTGRAPRYGPEIFPSGCQTANSARSAKNTEAMLPAAKHAPRGGTFHSCVEQLHELLTIFRDQPRPKRQSLWQTRIGSSTVVVCLLEVCEASAGVGGGEVANGAVVVLLASSGLRLMASS